MGKVTCPECGVFIDTEGKLEEKDLLDYWMDDEGIFHWHCLDCDYEWKGNFKGEKIL